MHFQGQEYKEQKDVLKLFSVLNVHSLQAALDKALNRLDKPYYEVAQFIISFFPHVEFKESVALSMNHHTELASYIQNKTYKANYIQLNIHDLAGLLNACGSFFNEQSLKLNALSFKHDDFQKNVNEVGINFNNITPYLDKEKLDIHNFLSILRESQNAFNGTKNYQSLLQYYKLHIEGKEYYIHDKESLLSTAMLSVDFFKIFMEQKIVGASEYIPTYSSTFNCIELACAYDSFDIVKYLVENLNVDLQLPVKHHQKDIFLKTLLGIRENSDKILDYLFNHIEYDFNTTYKVGFPPDIQAYKKQQKNGNSKYYMMMASYEVTLQQYLELRKEMDCPEEDKEKIEQFMNNYEKVHRVIERHKLYFDTKAKELIKPKMKL
jgi:hypothetical protein